MAINFSFDYPVSLIKQTEGGYLVQFPNFPEAITQGEEVEDALENGKDCLEEAVTNRMVMGLDIPLGVRSSKYQYHISLDGNLVDKCMLYFESRRI